MYRDMGGILPVETAEGGGEASKSVKHMELGYWGGLQKIMGIE